MTKNLGVNHVINFQAQLVSRVGRPSMMRHAIKKVPPSDNLHICLPPPKVSHSISPCATSVYFVFCIENMYGLLLERLPPGVAWQFK